MQGKRKNRGRAGGNAVIEVSLMVPWFLFLFLGVFDFGFYAYALIATENATRAAAVYLSSSYALAQQEAATPAPASSPGACQVVLGEMRIMPNVGNSVTNCNALPVQVQVAPPLLQPDNSYSTRVTVTYRTVQLFPIPGLTGRLTINRSAEMRIFGE
jgi:Flp pilus assembly protein TadG